MQFQVVKHRVAEAFREQFAGPPPRYFQAPGRVNLIGEHTDYNDGFVMPVAIDRQVMLAARARTDGRVRLWSCDFQQVSEFAVASVSPDPSAAWSNYVRGVAYVLLREALPLRGMDAVIAGSVPIGSGLSSSAALEVAAAVALCALSELDIAPATLALLCQQAENDFVGNKCGIMDQLIATLGQPGHALCIDCRSLCYQAVPLPSTTSVVVCDTMKRRGLVDSEYNARRQQCEQGVQLLRQRLPGISALRDVSRSDLACFAQLLPPVVARRCAHVLSENERVLSAVEALRVGNVERFGQLMNDSHASLRDDYEVSCAELDRMVAVARNAPGCLGARLTGAGFGGCTVNLVRAADAAEFARCVGAGYEEATGIQPEVYVCQASGGAAEVPASTSARGGA